MLKQRPTIERLRFLFEDRNGVLYWKNKSDPRSPAKPGDRAGRINANGYVTVCVDGIEIKGHIIVWAIHHGQYPEKMIDHINMVKSDNRIANLRAANNSLNSANKLTRIGSSGYRGVSFVRLSGRWQAYIKNDGVKRTIGTYDTAREAADAYNNAATEVFGQFAVLNP